jgi:hypothetical protein
LLTLMDVQALRRDLESHIEGVVRFDKVSRALDSTDASVYQIRLKTSRALARFIRPNCFAH